MERNIDVWQHANQIMGKLQKGVLLTTKAGDVVNTMTISWGTLGIEWGKPIFTAFVRENRFTKQLIDQNPEFTVSIPVGEFDKSILGICGTRSGRSTNKIESARLTLVEPSEITVPALRELPLTLECRVLYRQRQDLDAIDPSSRSTYYPQDVDGSYHGANRDPHTAYYGEIVAAYIVEQTARCPQPRSSFRGVAHFEGQDPTSPAPRFDRQTRLGARRGPPHEQNSYQGITSENSYEPSVAITR